jgi:hypothetical protein
MGIRGSSILLLLSVLLILSFVVQAQADSTWSVQTVDENGNGIGLSMALDSKDNPHLCYTAYVNGYYRNPKYLTYASWNGSDWSIQNVTGDVGRVGYSGLALDSNNNPHIAYSWGKLMYVSWTGEDWSIQTVDPEGGEGSLFLDSTDNPHIVYGGANGALKYAVLKDSNWSIQIVDTEEGLESTRSLFESAPSLALDSNDHPHVIYGYSTGNGNTTVKYAMWNGSSWNSQTVISNADVFFGNIALNSRGYPHFTYFNRTTYPTINGLLMYASWNGADWNTQVVDSITDEVDPGFLSFDSNNNPQVSYLNDVNHNVVLMYAEWTGTSWGIQTVDSSFIVMGFRSMVLDSSGNPCIGYYGGANQMHIGTVMYAKRNTILSPNQILLIALFVSLLLAVFIAVIVKKRITKLIKLAIAGRR